MSFYPPIPWNTQFFHMAARISILSDLQIILNILKHILQNAVGAKPIQFYHKPCETDGKHLYLNIQVTWGYTISNDDKKHSFDTLFFTFPPSFTQFTSSWPHPQFFLVFLWSLCAVLSLSDWKTPKQRSVIIQYRSHFMHLLSYFWHIQTNHNISTFMLNLNSSRTKIKFQSHILKGKSTL